MYYANWGYTAYGWMMKEGAGFKGRPVQGKYQYYMKPLVTVVSTQYLIHTKLPKHVG